MSLNTKKPKPLLARSLSKTVTKHFTTALPAEKTSGTSKHT